MTDKIDTPLQSISKSEAWDKVGGMFWKLGRKTAKPSELEIDLFLASETGKRLCVIGASTKDLVGAALDRNYDVTVMDFSREMCRALSKEFPSGAFEAVVIDILEGIPQKFAGQFDLVVSDRLLNRFTTLTAPSYFTNVFDLLNHGGVAKTCVKTGFYEMDLRLMNQGRKNGTLDLFFEEATRTIDYSAASRELSEITLSHGDIPEDILHTWYVGRGKESRFEKTEIIEMIDRALKGRSFEVLPTLDFSENESSLLFRVSKV